MIKKLTHTHTQLLLLKMLWTKFQDHLTLLVRKRLYYLKWKNGIVQKKIIDAKMKKKNSRVWWGFAE